MKLPPKPRAVITGAASGLGRSIALELAARGGRVLVCDIHPERAAETVDLAHAAGGQAVFFSCDVTQVANLERAAAEIERLWGGVDLIVNNAGVAAGGRMGEIPLEDWEWILRVNLWGVIHGCHVFIPRLKRQGHGFILNVASAAGLACMPEMASYNVTKAAVIALSETLYSELIREGISVSVLCPTFFVTNLLDTFRTPTDEHREIAHGMFRRSTMTAQAVARAGIRGLERGKLIIIPQTDGAILWRLKRLAPALFHRFLGRHGKALMVKSLAD